MQKKSKRLGQYLYENHDLDKDVDQFLEETAPLIGYIVHSFNSLDSQLNSSICSVINDRTDEIGAIILHKMAFTAKVDLFFRLVRSFEIAVSRSMLIFPKLIEDLKKCAVLRNAVVHAEWENVDSSGFTYVKMNFEKSGMHQQYWQFTPESLQKIQDFINETEGLFEKYEDELQDMYRA